MTSLQQKEEIVIALGDHVLLIERSPEGGLLRVITPAGARPLEIEITPAGPVLRLGGGLAVTVAGRLELGAEQVSIRARQTLELRSEGTAIVHAAGDMSVEAEACSISARLGDIELKANDDVIALGERIRMNC